MDCSYFFVEFSDGVFLIVSECVLDFYWFVGVIGCKLVIVGVLVYSKYVMCMFFECVYKFIGCDIKDFYKLICCGGGNLFVIWWKVNVLNGIGMWINDFLGNSMLLNV